MKKIVQKLGIVFLPAFFWTGLTALGFGAQSLSNLIELFGILLLSILACFIPERFVKFKYILITLLVIAFLARLLTPSIPE